ncbi:MAG: hypothetical protein K940chlam2_00725 [Chlamydiae bacterium]|nr:hypothetical protein [Chlamydiota bacterium]
MSTIGPSGAGGPSPIRPNEASPQEEQLAKQLDSHTGEVVQSLRQVLNNPDLANRSEYLNHLSQSFQALGESATKAAATGVN